MVYRYINRGVEFLREQGEPINSVLDIGCKDGVVEEKYTSIRDIKKKVRIDIENKYIEKCIKRNDNWTTIKMDAKNIKKYFLDKQFDLIIFNDVLEHLSKRDGKKLLEDCKKIGYYLMLFTPEGFHKQDSNIKSQVHVCGWSAKELHDMGFQVVIMKNYHTIFDGEKEIGKRNALFAFRYETKNICSNED